MIDKIENYKSKLEHEIVSYMSLPINTRSAEAVNSMIDCWEHINNLENALNECKGEVHIDEDLSSWADEMENADGTKGKHWYEEETTPFAETLDESVSTEDWNIAMNMMYSDYSEVAKSMGVDVPIFYARLADAFLNDKDSIQGHDKLVNYYNFIVKNRE